MRYFIKTPWILRALVRSCVWKIPHPGMGIYLSFDDGPHPVATPFVLDQLKNFGAKASFFCLGKNVIAYPEIYQRIISEGHRVGNHSFDHCNGWKTTARDYQENVLRASKWIDSNLFRPPYGKISPQQIRVLKQPQPEDHAKTGNQGFRIIQWDILSGDFDPGCSPEKCLENATKKTTPGSIIVFHDSAKAWERLSYALPRALEYYASKGFTCERVP
ncbi:MAG: polysaccharide deacetylase family protein [Chitinophagaceae bacterium]